MFQSPLNQSPQVSMLIRSERSSPFGFCPLDGWCIFSQRVIKEDADEFSFVGVALQSSNFCQCLVFLGADVGSGQFRSGLSLIWHVGKGICAVTG